MTSVFILTIFGMALGSLVEVTRLAPVHNGTDPSGLLTWPLGVKLPALPREGISHSGTAGRIVNETMQQNDLKDLMDTEWRLIQIDDRPVRAGSGPTAHLRLVSDGRKVEGFTGCNGLQGHYEELASQNVRFVGLATTRKLCPGLMEQERAFVHGLERARHWKTKDGQLVLMSEDHEAVLLFKAHNW